MRKFSIFFFLFSFISTFYINVFCQNIQSDFSLVLKKETDFIVKHSYYIGENNSQKIMQNKSVVQKINPLYYAAKAAMFAYQNIISQQLSKDCPYEVTCSNFCKKAIEEKGLFTGILFGADRLLRCNPFSFIGEEKTVKLNKNNKVIDPLFTF